MTMFSPKPRFDLAKFLKGSSASEAEHLAKTKRNSGYPSYPKPKSGTEAINAMLKKTR